MSVLEFDNSYQELKPCTVPDTETTTMPTIWFRSAEMLSCKYFIYTDPFILTVTPGHYDYYPHFTDGNPEKQSG